MRYLPPIRTLCPVRLVAFMAFFSACALFAKEPVTGFEAFKEKAARGEPVVIAYLGGSITAGASTWPRTGTNAIGDPYDHSSFRQNQHSWRALTYEWLRSRYETRPNQFRQVDAAIGGTPSLLGAYRLRDDVLKEKPDLVFIEFAVNDNGKAKLTEEHPNAPSSILRTLAFIVEQLRHQDPQVAIFMPLSTHRMLEKSSFTGWGRALDLGLEQSRLAAETLRIPYVDLQKAFYEQPSPDAALYYDGGDDAGNYVHPSPAGHRAYATAVQEALDEIFKTGTFSFQSSSGRTSPKPYPVRPTVVLAEQLAAYAPGWKTTTAQSAEAPSLQGRTQLVSGKPGDALEIRFNGTSIGIWCESGSKGVMKVELDGKDMGLYANGVKTRGKYNGRFADISSSLARSKRHTLRLTPMVDPDAPEPRIMIYAITIDGDVVMPQRARN